MTVWEPVAESAMPVSDNADGPVANFVPGDPLFASQLHLRNTNAGQFDLNVLDVWDDYTGDGIEITVIDSRVERFHPDYAGNYDVTTDWDYLSNDTAPESNRLNSERHGTAVIGIIAAIEGNGIGGVGVAYDATVRSYGGLGFEYLDEQIEDAAGVGDGFGNPHGGGDGADIVSMSFGVNIGSPTNQLFNNDMSGSYLPDVQATDTRLAEGSALGRGGLGTIYVKSAGNSRAAADSEYREESTAEAMDTSKYTIVVGATRWDGWIDNTSTPGANLLVVAPTDDLSGNSAVVTTDLTGDAGYNTATGTAGDYEATFGGTSAAAPQVSGIVALMLEANPQLGWRDVQMILAYSARHVGSAVGAAANDGAPTGFGDEQGTQGTYGGGASWFWNAASDWNGGGLHFSNDYGYGLVDAKAAVRLAETWRDQSTSANQTSASRDVDGPGVTTSYGSSFTTFVATEMTDIRIEHVSLNIEVQTLDDMNDMEVYVTSAAGTRVQAIADTGGSQGITPGNSGFTAGSGFDWQFGITAFWGETSAGDWTVEIRNDDGPGNGAFVTTDVDLHFYGGAIDDDALFVFTNEFDDYDSVGGHTTVFDGDGAGTDVINAAAVDTDTVIDLRANTGTIDGVGITSAQIHVVYTGDGNDTITGDGIDTELYAGRGDDVIFGGSLGETLGGGAGDDLIYAGTGGDTVEGGAGEDEIFGSSGADSILGGQDDDVLYGGSGLDEIDGGDGEDRVFGSVGADSVAGGSGDDTLDGGVGDDLVYGGFGDDSLNGSSDDDELHGSFGNDTISGGSGDDQAFGGAGDDAITGGIGRDALFGGGDDDDIDGGGSDDSLIGDAGSDTLAGGAGDDKLFGGGDGDTVLGDDGEDVAFGGAGMDLVYGGADNDTAYGGADADIVEGGGGDDLLFGSLGDDWVFGGTGNDLAYGGTDDDVVEGGEGDDLLFGSIGNDSIGGGKGNDEAYGGTADDIVDGGDGDDMLFGAGGDDTVLGGEGDDTVNGGTGNDTVNGGADDDLLTGSSGDDVLIGGSGDDTLDGGSGADTFLFDEASWGQDTLTGWQDGQDLLDFTAVGLGFGDFAAVSSGGGTLLTLDADPGQTLFLDGIAPGTIDGFDFV